MEQKGKESLYIVHQHSLLRYSSHVFTLIDKPEAQQSLILYGSQLRFGLILCPGDKGAREPLKHGELLISSFFFFFLF